MIKSSHYHIFPKSHMFIPLPTSPQFIISWEENHRTWMKTDPGRMNNKCVRAAPCTPNNTSVCCNSVQRSWRSSLFLGSKTRVVYPKSNNKSPNSSSLVMRRVLSRRKMRVTRGRHGNGMSGTTCPFQAIPRRF